MSLSEATVTIYSVRESRTKPTHQRPAGWRRFLIGAERTSGELLTKAITLTTLDPWKASLCDQARQSGRTVRIAFRDTGYFDADLVSVEIVTSQVSA